jgi:hypothetical protein
VISVPILRDLFSQSDDSIAQTDIVMLLTPRIIRTHEYTAQDLSPIFVGTNQNFGLTGPPPLIAAPPVDAQPAAPGPTPPGQTPPAQELPPQGLPVPTAPPGGTPGLVTTPTPAVEQQSQVDLTKPANPPATTLTSAQLSVTAPTDARVGAGPYLVPVFISGVSRASTVTVTVTYNPAVLRVRNMQEGSFLRQGGINVVFTPSSDAVTGRLDLAFVRTGDAVGASGSGMLAAIQFDAIAAGSSALTVSGVVTNPTGATIPVQFVPGNVVVR